MGPWFLALALMHARGTQAAEPATPGRGRRPGTPPTAQAMRIDVRGAVAHVTVTRSMSCVSTSGSGRIVGGSTSATAADGVLDVALPAGAALLDVTIGDGGRPQVAKPVAFAKARDAYVESLRAWGVSGSEVSFEDETTFRFRVACNPSQTNKSIDLKYTFTVLLEFLDGRFRLAFPAAAELAPPATRVEVHAAAPSGFAEISIAGATHEARGDLKTGVAAGASVSDAAETITTRHPWVVSFLLARARPPRPEHADDARLVALTSVASRQGRPLWTAYAVGSTTGARHDLPARVLFLIDRSRSVGPGGLESEREAARRVLEAMPPATRFDALFFDRAVKRLFPVARAATRETMAALDDEMVPARMGNGTDLSGVLQAARDLLRREADAFAPRCLLVLLTDGAVGAPEHAAELATLLKPPAGVELTIAVLSVRPNDDPAVSAAERRVLRGLTAMAAAGVERTLKSADLAEGIPAILEALRVGGDVYGISLGTKTQEGGTAGGNVIEVLAPGGGASGVLPPRGGAATPGALARPIAYRGAARPLSVRPTAVNERWLEPLAASASAKARLLISPGLSALVEPVSRPAAASSAASRAEANLNPAGYMERSVVRDSLSLAFTPRARACYLNRPARTAAERDLTGRVRLALDLVRGEVAGVRVESTTLSYPAIETCLREAAYAIEVPRAYRNDEAVTAVLNLVFRPRTPERRTGDPGSPNVSHEIDMMVEAALKESQTPPDQPATAGPLPSPTPVRPAPADTRVPDAGTPDGAH